MTTTLVEQQSWGDRSPCDEDMEQTIEIVRAIDDYDFPLSKRKVIEVAESLIACRVKLRSTLDSLAALQARLDRIAEIVSFGQTAEKCWESLSVGEVEAIRRLARGEKP